MPSSHRKSNLIEKHLNQTVSDGRPKCKQVAPQAIIKKVPEYKQQIKEVIIVFSRHQKTPEIIKSTERSPPWRDIDLEGVGPGPGGSKGYQRQRQKSPGIRIKGFGREWGKDAIK